MPASDQFPHTRIYRENTSRETVASGGRLKVEPGGLLDLATATGVVQFAPGEVEASDISANLRTGNINLHLRLLYEQASASGQAALTTGTNPAYGRVSGTNDITERVRWTTAAGTTDPAYFPPVLLPADLDDTTTLLVDLYGEKGSAQAAADVAVRVQFVTATNDRGTTVAFTSTPTRQTVTVASGLASAGGVMNVAIAPNAHASGVIDLYGAGVRYQRRS